MSEVHLEDLILLSFQLKAGYAVYQLRSTIKFSNPVVISQSWLWCPNSAPPTMLFLIQ